MTVRVDLNGLLAAAVGAGGLAAEEVTGLEPELARRARRACGRRAAGALAFAELPHRTTMSARPRRGSRRRADVDTLVVLALAAPPSARAR